MSESVLLTVPPQARGLMLLTLLLVLAVAMIVALVLIRWSRRLTKSERVPVGRRPPPRYVDAWRESGRRAELEEPGPPELHEPGDDDPDDGEDDAPRR